MNRKNNSTSPQPLSSEERGDIPTKPPFFRFAVCLASLLVVLSMTGSAAGTLSNLKTFGTVGKQLAVLTHDGETELFRHAGKGCLTHMWFGGDFKDYDQTRLRVYVDGETNASIDMEMFLGHGIGFADKSAPWGVARIGKTGDPSGVYDTYRIPFGKGVRVTAQLAPTTPNHPDFWWIIRGTENLPVELGGIRLPERARLRMYKLERHLARPLEEFALCNVRGEGALYEVTMAAKGSRTTANPGDRWKDLSYMEGCMRVYLDGADQPLLLSSGLEDYFCGTYYFNKGRYYTDISGLTHLNAEAHEFSAYRFHDQDPVFFHQGMRLACRCGDTVAGNVIGDPPPTEYTTYVWVYQW